jgi:hypothetical protein
MVPRVIQGHLLPHSRWSQCSEWKSWSKGRTNAIPFCCSLGPELQRQSFERALSTLRIKSDREFKDRSLIICIIVSTRFCPWLLSHLSLNYYCKLSVPVFPGDSAVLPTHPLNPQCSGREAVCRDPQDWWNWSVCQQQSRTSFLEMLQEHCVSPWDANLTNQANLIPLIPAGLQSCISGHAHC